MNELPPNGNGPQPEIGPQGLARPGISPEMLRLAGVCSVTAEMAEKLTDRPFSGLWIPYSNLDGTPVLDAGVNYGRIRLLEPVGKQKYHQRAGSKVHAYLTPGLLDFPVGSPLFVIEGEFKALALRQAGYLAVGVGGFYGFGRESGTVLAPELDAVLSRFKPTQVYFCGDTDAVTNYQFFDAAFKLQALLRKHPHPPTQLFLLCVPVNSPGKGFDDTREVLKNDFNPWFEDLRRSEVPLNDGQTASVALVERVAREQAKLASLQGADKLKAQHNLVSAAAYMTKDLLRRAELVGLFSKIFTISKSDFKDAIKQFRASIAAKPNGNNRQPKRNLPAHIPLPCDGTTTYTDSAKALFALLKLNGNYYRQGGSLVAVNSDGESAKLEPVSPESLRTRAENLNAPLKRSTMTPSGPTFAPANMMADEAKVLLASTEIKQLNLIRGVLPLPILTLGSDGKPRMLGPGYDVATQLFITAKVPLPPLPPVAEAVRTINSLFVDFRFQDGSDQSRAVAMFLTMALTVAGMLPGHNPMFVIEADDSQTGKGLLSSLLANVFKLRIAAVAQHPGRGLGSQEDSFYAALELGQPLVVFDNWRGKLNCPALEQFMTQRSGGFPVRVAYKAQREVDRGYYLLALTSNGCELTPDQANRSVLIRLLKQPEDYPFPSFPEGDFPAHVLAHWERFACAIFSVISEWLRLGRPTTHAQYNSFTQWAQSLDWIVQNLFTLPPLLAGMKEEKARVSSPSHSFLRSIALAVAKAEKLGHRLTAAALAEIAVEAGISIPSASDGPQGGAKGIGICLAHAFGKSESVRTDVYTVTRDIEVVPRNDSDAGGPIERKIYTFSPSKPQQPAGTAGTLPKIIKNLP